MSTAPVLETALPGLAVRRGKVRDVYELPDRPDQPPSLLLVATDRISAFDVVMANGIPDKGRILTALSRFWFERLAALGPHHLRYVVDAGGPLPLPGQDALLRGRAMVCERTDVVPVECVVRGYLAGSGWKEYEQSRRVCGVALPAGLRRCERLPAPIFTPATKAAHGHDENITFERAAALVGGDLMRELRDRSVALYEQAARHAAGHGVIIADTKFEFGRRLTGSRDILLIDEALTPDSSRFWPADQYQPGREPPSYDKQFVRNHLEALCAAGRWDKRPPGPVLPDEVVAGTRQRYLEAFLRLTGRPFAA